MAKSDNLLAILWMLRSRTRMTAAQISEELEVDVRTVYRYIDALSASGAPIIAEPGPSGGYALLDTFRETPLFFSDAERIALAHAGLFARQAGYPYSNDLEAALTKVERQLSPEQLYHLRQHTAGLDVIDTAPDPDRSRLTLDHSGTPGADNARPSPEAPFSVGEGGNPAAARHPRGAFAPLLKTIEESVAEGRRLHIAHVRDLSRPPLERGVDPYGLIYWREMWYLLGYCHLREDIRMFRCDRIRAIEATGELFEHPEGFSAREHFLETMVPQTAARDTVTIRLRGTPYILDSITRHWFFANFIAERTRDELGLAVDIELASDYLPYLVLSAAGELTILEPAELRELVVRFARQVAEANDTRPSADR